MAQDRFRSYVDTQRRTRRFQRLADLVFLGIILVALAGAGVGLMPELEKSAELDEKIALETENKMRDEALLHEKERRLHLLLNDVTYMEQEYRNRAPRAAKPGETLLVVPPERRSIYSGDVPE